MELFGENLRLLSGFLRLPFLAIFVATSVMSCSSSEQPVTTEQSGGLNVQPSPTPECDGDCDSASDSATDSETHTDAGSPCKAYQQSFSLYPYVPQSGSVTLACPDNVKIKADPKWFTIEKVPEDSNGVKLSIANNYSTYVKLRAGFFTQVNHSEKSTILIKYENKVYKHPVVVKILHRLVKASPVKFSVEHKLCYRGRAPAQYPNEASIEVTCPYGSIPLFDKVVVHGADLNVKCAIVPVPKIRNQSSDKLYPGQPHIYDGKVYVGANADGKCAEGAVLSSVSLKGKRVDACLVVDFEGSKFLGATTDNKLGVVTVDGLMASCI